MDPVQLSNIREHLGWIMGQKVVDVTANDPDALPDGDPEDGWFVVLHFENGGTLEFPVDEGFHFSRGNE